MPEQIPVASPATSFSLFRFFRYLIIIVILVLAIMTTITFSYYLTPPADFPIDTDFVVKEGMSGREVAKALTTQGFVKSEIVFYLTLLINSDPTTIKASTYRFNEPLTPRQLVDELTAGHFGHSLIRVTLTEGERARTFATRVAPTLMGFDPTTFISLAEPVEGTLFPDTYLVPQNFSAEQMFELLTKTFAERIAPLKDEIEAHQLTQSEIITLASIIEREANTPQSMAMVSGILQNRLAINMPLQADASIEYVLNKPLSELTPSDLKQDSPYNTYTNTGLPPTPIGNPGLSAITAVLRPTPSQFYYYISGDDGNFYYARTFDEHRVNIARYLR